MDIYNYKKKFERAIARVKENQELSDENKELALKFKDYLLSEGIGTAKIERYLIDIVKFARMLNKPFPNATKEDIRGVIGQLEQTGLAAETKKSFKIMLRKLYRFIRGVEEKGVYPEEVKWISINIPANHKKLPEELLTEEECFKIIQNCRTLRDKALISTLIESGCRVGEIGTMQIKHVSFEEYGARLTVNGKTGMRKILVINSAPYLQEWINQHPNNKNPESYIWFSFSTDNLLSYARISEILKGASRKAGIKKRVYCHLTRHTRATKLASIMPEAGMKQYFGWTQGSKMAGVYIHMSGKETDEAIMRLNGIEVQKEKIKPLLEPKQCLKCKTINEATNRFCRICGFVLDEETGKEILQKEVERSEMDSLMNELVKDKEILEMLVKKIKEKKLNI
jgi:site-specific recombinase XerD